MTVHAASYQDFDTAAHTNKINEERKADLWKSHFNIGNPNVGQFTSTMQSSYQVPGGNQADFNAEKARDLKASHFSIGETKTVDYNTQHSISYKWV